jgi:hypothetical protein
LILAVWLGIYFSAVLERDRGYEVRTTGAAPGTITAPAD